MLTLSATPIPRTLNMAMSGIRDLSPIEQPPIERQPVETFVLEYNDVILAEAMKKELARGGQVYYLHNRVDNIEACAAHVSQMVPGARVGIAHGKMTEEELNPVWQHLLNGEIDILVCTTLIETGIDVRNCNTLIIEDADRMGLAQLYQIRGRVGRSGRKAYAYFTFRRDKTLTDIAQKRLSAIREFTAFGSGFRIAMRDLQIRGAGSLLGHSQHGHMEAVGYDLYVKMLGQAIARAKGEPVQRDKSECLVDLRVDAYIPEKYIADGPGRIEAYKRIAAIQTPEDAADVLDELIDRYGDPPPSVSDLVNVSLVRVQATAVGVYLSLIHIFSTQVNGLLCVARVVGVGHDQQLTSSVCPAHKAVEVLVAGSGDGCDLLAVDVAGGAIDGDPVALDELVAVDLEGLCLLIDLDLVVVAATGDTAGAHTTGNNGGVRGHTAADSQDALSGLHALNVLGRGLQTDQDHLLAPGSPFLGVLGGVDVYKRQCFWRGMCL